MIAQPRYADLPLQPSSHIPHSWNVFGDGDELGTVNRIDADAVRAAATDVRCGQRVCLSLPITEPNPPLYGRSAVRHSISKGVYGWNDQLDGFDLQGSTQWDGLRHIHGRSDGFYGGWDGDDAAQPQRLGVQSWARQGIVGRGVLADIAGLDGWTDHDPMAGGAISPDDLTAALDAHEIALRQGDILCVRTGWLDRYQQLDADERARLAQAFRDDAAAVSWRGLAGDDAMARYLWDSGISAVAVDNPGVEVSPGDPWFGTLHRRLIPGLGFAIGELFTFAELAAACAAAGRYEFFFVSVPLNVPGGVGSPANAIAIL